MGLFSPKLEDNKHSKKQPVANNEAHEIAYSLEYTPITPEKEMSNGMRMSGNTPLDDSEIRIVEKAIREIEAEREIFVFNDPNHLSNTCYNEFLDIVFVGRNVFPDIQYGSTHPRDIMSIRAVLAHEYYGHRTFRDEYLSDYKKDIITTPKWQDECRASISAAKLSPGLTQMDKSHLVLDAIKRAEEYGQWIKTDDFMKEVLYGYSNPEKERNIVPRLEPIVYVRAKSKDGDVRNRTCTDSLPEMQNDSERESRGFIR